MKCCVCHQETDRNCGTVEVPVCDSCSETIEGQEIIKGLTIGNIQQQSESVATPPKTMEQVRGNGTLRGILIGAMAMVLIVGVFYYFKDFSKTSIVKECLAYYNIQVESVEILQYSTYPTSQGVDLQNFIVQGSSKGFLYRAKVQYMEGRDPGQNGVEFQQGSSTMAMGSFYNF